MMRPAMRTLIGRVGFELLGGEGVVGDAQLGDGVARRVGVGIGGWSLTQLAESGDLLQLLPA